MKRAVMGVFTVALLCSLGVGTSSAREGLGLYGIGGRLSYVSPDNLDGTIGLGIHADLGEVFVENLKIFPSIEYWSKSESGGGIDTDFSQLTVNADARYYFPASGSIAIFAGGGLVLAFYSTDVSSEFGEFDASSTDIGLDFLGGIDLPIQENLILTAEAKFLVSDQSVFRISAGLTFMLGK